MSQPRRRTRDVGWDRLASVIEETLAVNYRLKVSPSSPKELADAINSRLIANRQAVPSELVTAETVRYWIYKRSNPELRLIPIIGEALGVGSSGSSGWDPLLLPRALGVIQESETVRDVGELAFSVQRLQNRFNDLQGALGSNSGRGGAASIVARATQLASSLADSETNQKPAPWAVAVWPAIEGPPDCRLHVADRIDFRRVDDSAFTRADLWRDFEDEFRASGAIEANSIRRWMDPSGGGVSHRTDGETRCAHWSVPYVGSPRSSAIAQPWPGLAALATIATSLQSWANDVASHIADTIGYGLAGTRDMSMDLFGVRDGRSASSIRTDLHAMLLATPPVKRVWSHWAANDPILAGQKFLHPSVRAIWLSESDTLLRLEAHRKIYSADDPDRIFEVLQRARRQGDEAAARMEGQVLRIDLEFTAQDGARPIEDRRRIRWAMSLQAARQAVQSLISHGELDLAALESIWHSDRFRRQHTRQVQRWMSTRLHRG